VVAMHGVLGRFRARCGVPRHCGFGGRPRFRPAPAKSSGESRGVWGDPIDMGSMDSITLDKNRRTYGTGDGEDSG